MTTPMDDPKFTDRDVRESLDLQRAAKLYLYRYGGDFDFLVRAKHHLEEVGKLPTVTIRGVLNCMRSDPAAAMIIQRPPKLELVRPIPRRYARRLEATFKYPYLSSTYPTATLAHLLDPSRTALWWHPQSLRFTFEPVVYCGMRFGRPNPINTKTIPAGKQECHRCAAAERMAQ